jgi:hypothetical protein
VHSLASASLTAAWTAASRSGWQTRQRSRAGAVKPSGSTSWQEVHATGSLPAMCAACSVRSVIVPLAAPWPWIAAATRGAASCSTAAGPVPHAMSTFTPATAMSALTQKVATARTRRVISPSHPVGSL